MRSSDRAEWVGWMGEVVMLRLCGIFACGLCAVLTAGDVWSQDKAVSREREALRRAQQQVQQVRQEKSVLEEKLLLLDKEKGELAAQKQKLSGQVAGAAARARVAEAKGQQLQTQLDGVVRERVALGQDKSALEAQAVLLGQRLAVLETRIGAVERDLLQTTAQKKQVEAAFAGSQQAVAGCEDRNSRLYRVGRDLISQCRDRSATETVLRLEPFTGLKQVEIENMLEGYRDKLDAQKSIP